MQVFKNWNELNEKILKLSKYQVNSLENANIYYSKNYESFEKMAGGKCIYIGDARAVIVLAIRRKYFFKWGMFPSEPLYFDQNLDITEDYERSFLDDVMSIVKPQYVSWIECSGTGANFKAYPTKSERIPFGNYIVNLLYSEEELFKRVTSKGRNMIRRAEKDGINIVSGGMELLDEYIKIDTETWQRSRICRNSYKIYKKYLQAFNGKTSIYLAKKDDVVQGGAIFIFNKKMSYYMYGASVDKHSPGALNLLQWQAMLEFKKRGTQKHNFVGCRINEDHDSKYHGIQKFKSSFGGDLIQGFMFKDTSNSFMYRLFKLAMKLRHPMLRSKGDIIDQEIHKWKEINT